MHVGNIRTALFNYLYAIKNNGKFILRIDDTDSERSTDEFAEQIVSDLKWLGIKIDKIYNCILHTTAFNISQHKSCGKRIKKLILNYTLPNHKNLIISGHGNTVETYTENSIQKIGNFQNEFDLILYFKNGNFYEADKLTFVND